MLMLNHSALDIYYFYIRIVGPLILETQKSINGNTLTNQVIWDRYACVASDPGN